MSGDRLATVSSRLILFNRVAKVLPVCLFKVLCPSTRQVGSQSLTRLMVELSQKRGYKVEVSLLAVLVLLYAS